jgi:hypothetical protein
MRRGTRFLLLLSVSISCTGLRAEESAAQLQACMQANLPPALRVNQFEMITEREGLTETLSGKLFVQQDPTEKALTLQIEAPSHYRGSAYLFLERDGKEQMFIYLPATGRVRQISGGSMDGAFFGSAFRYSDIRQAMGLMTETRLNRGADQRYDEGPVATLVLQPSEAAAAEGRPPPLSTLLVETEHCVPLHLRVERAGQLLREFAGKRADLIEDQGRWHLAKGQMVDHERGARTDVRLGELRGFESIPRAVFHRSSFYFAVFTKK